jgi:hypothetical protein
MQRGRGWPLITQSRHVQKRRGPRRIHPRDRSNLGTHPDAAAPSADGLLEEVRQCVSAVAGLRDGKSATHQSATRGDATLNGGGKVGAERSRSSKISGICAPPGTRTPNPLNTRLRPTRFQASMAQVSNKVRSLVAILGRCGWRRRVASGDSARRHVPDRRRHHQPGRPTYRQSHSPSKTAKALYPMVEMCSMSSTAGSVSRDHQPPGSAGYRYDPEPAFQLGPMLQFQPGPGRGFG